jgi:tetratricopeptide (TPR) repeat protein
MCTSKSVIGVLAILLFLLFAPPWQANAQDKQDEELAMMFFRDGNYAKAAALYEKLYDKSPKQHYYTYLLYCRIETAEFKEAEKLVRKHLRQNNNDPRYLVDLGYINARHGDMQEAEKLYRQALRETNGSRGSILTLANAFLTRQLNDYALDAYKRGRELNKEYQYRMEIAQIYERMGRFPEMLDEYLALAAEDPSALTQVQGRLQNVLADDPDGLKNEAFRESLLLKVQREPHKTFLSELLLWHSIQQKDFELALLQASALDKRLGEDGKRVYDLALLAEANEDYDVALSALDYVIGKGDLEPYFMLATITHLNVRYSRVMARYEYDKASLMQLESEHKTLLAEFGYSDASLPLLMNLARLQAFYLDRPDDAIALLEETRSLGTLNPSRLAEIKLELGDIYLFTGEVWEATLLYSQVDKAFKNDAVGHMAKLKNARLSFYIGEFDWAKAQLDVLKAATSKLIANDAMELSLLIGDNQEDDSTQVALLTYARADLFLYRNKVDSAMRLLNGLESAFTWHPILDDVLMKKAEIYSRLQDFRMADSMYALVQQKYPYDIFGDDALFFRGKLAEERFKDKDKAMAFYEKLMFDYPGSLFVVDARKRFRNLRGDILN